MGFYDKKFKLLVFDLLPWLVLIGPPVSVFCHPWLPWWYLVTQTIDLYTYISHLFDLILVTDSKYVLHSLDSLYNLQSKRLVTISVSLHTQTGLCHLTIQALHPRVWFLDIWYTSLTSVHYNLEYGLAIVTESFSPLDLDYTTSLVKVQIRSDRTSHAIPFCHAH